MNLTKLANYFQIKLASSVQEMLNKIQQAHANASTALSKMEALDPGYDELRTLTGTLYHIWNQSKAKSTENFKFNLESQLPKLKQYSLLILAKTKPSARPFIQNVVKNLHTMVPVDLIEPGSETSPVPSDGKKNIV